ncbi:Nucleotide exchange factor SIL1 [Collichthys lucidus]|uniref:Nucleotide exchange factor SIL1 n=1 Tax=Collichthys lucidus TaxID=240159 RepID=A0A4U5UBV0_COLLU|nr:Nucleotide exchange factor SIL1 [Collichthys lucidus]
MKSLSESQRALELERKLFSSERLLKQVQSDKIKLQLRVEELQHKYEPKDAKKNPIQKRKKEKLPVDITPSEDTTIDKGQHGVAVEMDVTNTKTEDPVAHTSPTAEAVNATQGVCSGGQCVCVSVHVILGERTGERNEHRADSSSSDACKEEGRAGRFPHEVESSFSPEELKQAMKKIKEDMNSVSKDTEPQDPVASRYRPLEELKRDMAQLDLLVETDVQIMRRLLDQLNSSNSTTEQKLSILLELEYLVHQVDNAQTLCSMGGLQNILQGLNSSDFRIQERCAFVLGSALSSNPVVQVKAAESGALQTLLTMLATTQPLQVKKKVLFAVASLLRHFPYAQRHFLSHGGLQVLSELFRADRGGVLRTRIVTMLYDMISEKELISQAGLDPALDASHEERVRQYSKVSLQEELLEKGWCSLVPQLLESTEHDYREKALQALLAMAPVCLDQYRSDSTLLGSLLYLRDQYQEMVQSEMILGEESGYFAEIIELIDALQVKMK